MKDKFIKRVDPLTGMSATFKAINDQSFRNDLFRTEEEAFIVDTVCTPDTETWETAISTDGNKSFIPVEQYDSRESAEKGHQKWVESMTADPNQKLTEIVVWE